jgi:hypothetical protein
LAAVLGWVQVLGEFGDVSMNVDLPGGEVEQPIGGGVIISFQ